MLNFKARPVSTEAFQFAGGLDLVTPALSLQPGQLIDAVNYEPDINGGYRRMYGYERYDGRTSPSDATYSVVTCTITGTVAAGNTITGATSGATAVVLQVNGTTELIVTKVTGTFVAESFTVAAVSQGTISSVVSSAGSTPALHARYKNLAADNYRSDIGAVPGSGPVRGVKYYNGNVYAFRDNAGATACVMYKATTSGWTAVNFGREIQFVQSANTVTVTSASPGVVTWTAHGLANGHAVVFTSTGTVPTGLTAGTTYYVSGRTANTFRVSATVGGAEINTSSTGTGTITCTAAGVQINEGDVITGASSGATATVRRALLRTGTWTVAPVGTLVFDSVTGTFQNGEALQVNSDTTVEANGADTAITLLPGGRFEFELYNFSGAASTYRMYGCDGVNKAFEFDGTRLVPIRTNIDNDTPTFIAAWKNMLVLALDSSIQLSGIGDPYSWTALTGASELALGAVCTGLKPQLGDANNGALAITTLRNTQVLYGNSSADFRLTLQSPDAGAFPYTIQNIGFAYYLDTKGVVQINSSRNYGNFISSTLTRAIQPIIDAKRGLAKCSCIIRATNQYRIFFSDGSGIILSMAMGDPSQGQAETLAAIMYFDYGSSVYMNTVDSYVDNSGIEHVMAASSNGYVYELEKGTSFDGANIQSRIFTAFNSSKAPRTRKHYKRTILNVTCKNTAQVSIGYDLSYGNIEVQPGANTSQTLIGNGSYWDVMTWDNFNFDAPYVAEYRIDTPGNGRNINFVIYGDTDEDEPYTIHSAITHYINGRLER